MLMTNLEQQISGAEFGAADFCNKREGVCYVVGKIKGKVSGAESRAADFDDIA